MSDAPNVALVVDLDGTLVHTDLLAESVFALARQRPLDLARLPGWLWHGKGVLKEEIADRTALDIAHLPYNQALLDYLTRAKQQGRRLILATAASRHYAHQVAKHLQLFDDVLTSDAQINLSGETKLAAIRKLLGSDTPFDYAADHEVDRAVWRAARETILVGVSPKTDRWASRETRVGRRIQHGTNRLRAWIEALRVYQWSKNLLVFVPLLAAHRILDGQALLGAIMAFMAYSVLASSVYLFNDLVDLSDDRRHPNKRHRPFANGTLPIAHGITAIPVLLLIAAAITWFLPPLFAAVLAGYYAVTLAYSLGLKRIVLIDVLTLAALYTLRLIAGGAATAIPLSFWLLALSMSMFLSLAMAKRCAELRLVRDGETDGGGRGYAASDLGALESLGTAAGYAGIVILALYINSPAIIRNYSHPRLFWLLCPVVLYWISRIWLQTIRGHMTDDPIVFAVSDNGSRICIVLGISIIVVAAL